MNESDYFFSYIGIQADKQKEALASMFDLINNLPLSKQGFAIAKQSILNKIESERITKSAILSSYFEAEDRGIAFDIRSSVYEEVKKMSFDDLLNFHKEFITNNNHNILVVGNKDKIDFENLKQYGKVQEVSLEEIFGY
jgi:zinc protease